MSYFACFSSGVEGVVHGLGCQQQVRLHSGFEKEICTGVADSSMYLITP
jgi:hypothetical protein